MKSRVEWSMYQKTIKTKSEQKEKKGEGEREESGKVSTRATLGSCRFVVIVLEF